MMSLATVVMMVGPPGEPRTSSGLPGLHCRLGAGAAGFRADDDGGRHGGERALAGGDGVGGALDEAEAVGRAGLGGEVVHLVVEQEAEARRR